MKKTFIFTAVVLFVCAFGQVKAQEEKKGLGSPIEEEVFMVVETPAEFPGGMEEFYKFLNSNIEYPKEAHRKGIEGKVFARFIVEKDGSISNIELLTDIGYGCGEEVVRVIKLMPKWSPAKVQGSPVRCYFHLPFKFTLPQK